MHKEYILLNGFRKAKRGFTAGFHVPLRLIDSMKRVSKCPSLGGCKGGFAAIPLLLIHGLKSTRMRHF